jgi:sugar transferase (PEP-CTERM system associated)
MIHVFNHYIPSKMAVLACLEAAVLVVVAQFGITLYQFVDAHAAISAAATASPAAAVLLAAIMMLVMAGMGLYQSDLWNNTQWVRARLFAPFALGFAVAGAAYMLAPTQNPNVVALGATTMMLACAGILSVRAAFHKWNGLAALKSRVLVLGTGSRVARLAEYAQRNPNHDVVGYVSLQPAKSYVPAPKLLRMAPGETLLSIVEKHGIDQIVVAVRDRRAGGFPIQQLLDCKMGGVKIVELPTFFEREYRQVMLESLNPSWVVLGDGFRQSALGGFTKRVFDLFVSVALLLLCLPVLLIAAVCIVVESGFPVFYRQERVGQGGRVFTLYKLRSMHADAERDGVVQWAAANDDRTTRVGRVLRRFRIDELPQIINVLKGEMSFVGPRPERPFFVEQLVKQIPYYALRHSVKPGISGWAQVRYSYAASVDDAVEKLQHDLYYVKNYSLFLDFMVLLSTVEVVLWGKGAR